MTRVVLLHGKNKTADDAWYPWIKAECSARTIECTVPALTTEEVPRIADWLADIDAVHPDEETILIGHSRGGMAALRWLEQPDRPVKRVILVATNGAHLVDAAGGDFYSGAYDFETIRHNCADIVLLHSRDDEWVPYVAAQYNAEHLGGRLISLENKNHFGMQSDGMVMREFPELLAEIVR